MAKANTVTVEVWVVVDENGDFAVGHTTEAAVEDYEARIQGIGEAGNRRVKLTLTVPLPEVIELTAEVSADETAGVTVG